MQTISITGRAPAVTRARKASKRSVRPRFKNPLPEAPEPVLPPLVKQADEGSLFGQYDPIAAAERDGHPLIVLMRLRQAAADEVERLLAFLDATDGDPDLEALDEPTLAEVRKAACRYRDEQEDEEPSLGFTENHPDCHDTGDGWRFPYRCGSGNQTHPQGNDDDREGCEHDGREPDCDDEDGGDDEPSLGWTPAEAGVGGVYAGSMGQMVDLEEACDDEGDRSDSGIGDADGLLEQVGGISGCYTSGYARAAI